MMKNILGAIECGGLDARPTELTGNRQRKKYITEYDCANLRLELELWTDSKHCIDHRQDYPLLKSRTSSRQGCLSQSPQSTSLPFHHRGCCIFLLL
ncbi:MAG: hypothetical protein ABSE00_03410 [Chitinispirillaceae bacterium]